MKIQDIIQTSFKNFISHRAKILSPILILSFTIVMFQLTLGLFNGIVDGVNQTILGNDNLKAMTAFIADSGYKPSARGYSPQYNNVENIITENTEVELPKKITVEMISNINSIQGVVVAFSPEIVKGNGSQISIRDKIIPPEPKPGEKSYTTEVYSFGHTQKYTETSMGLGFVGVPEKALRYFGINRDKFETTADVYVPTQDFPIVPSNIKLNLHIPMDGIFEGCIKINQETGSSENISCNLTGKVVDKFTFPEGLSVFGSQYYYATITTMEAAERLNALGENLTLEEYRAKKAKTGYSTIIVFVDDVSSLEKVSKEIDKLGITTSYALKESKFIPSFAQNILAIGSVIILLLGVFGILSIHSMITQLVRGRFREIGIMKAIGFTASQIRNIFLGEMFLIVFTTCLISLGATAGIFLIINSLILNGDNLLGLQFNLTMDAFTILYSVIIIFLMIFLTSINAILKTSYLSIIDTIRKEN
jgi:ABC-type lipoprotein release transport system permease subunit